MPGVRFGLFEFNSDTGELLREGRPVRLQAQPAKLLALLIAARGELVTRESLRAALWPDGTNVDFDRGLNFAVAQVRTALNDSAESPAFIRTIPKRGYQFIAPLPEPAVLAPPPPRRSFLLFAVVMAVAVVALGVAAIWEPQPAAAQVAIAHFENETGRAEFDQFAGTLTDSLVAGLTEQTAGRFGIIGNAALLRRARKFQDIDEIASTLHTPCIILGQLQKDGAGFRVLAHLIALPSRKHLKVSRRELAPGASDTQAAEQIIADILPSLNSSQAANR
jgi:DNA-binding winged helix-turn-helix (wHTH) protein/TolB-like protein